MNRSNFGIAADGRFLPIMPQAAPDSNGDPV